MHGTVPVGDGQLLGELLELVGVGVVVVGVGVAHDPHRLARVGAAHRRLVLAAGEERVLVPEDAARLGRGDEARADPDAVGPERERGGQAPAVEDAAGGDDGDPVADRVDDLRDERERGDLSGVAAGLGALGDHEVAPGLDGTDGVLDLAAHADHDEVVLVAEVDHLGRHAQPGHECGGAALDDHLDLLGHARRAWR